MTRTSERGLRTALALAPPLVAFAIQSIFWDLINPFVWFLFFPAVFVSSWIGGLRGGLAATTLATAIVWWSFVPPTGSLFKEARYLFPAGVFLAMGIAFSLFHHRLRAAQRRLAQSSEEVRRLYERTKELDELKSQFFANVSHELRTPLTLILAPTEKRLASPATPDDERDDLTIVARNARALLRQVEDLLDASKLEAGRLTLTYAKADLAALVRVVGDDFAGLARDREIALTIDAVGPVTAEADPEKVRRVLVNLLGNAFKFTPRGGRVRVSLHADPPRSARIEVADSGPGIPPDKRELVFERFRQVEGGASRRVGGTGLGLTIARELVTLHRGTIAITDAPEGGALFTVELPLRAPEAVEVRADELAATHAAARQAVEELGGSAAPVRAGGTGKSLVLVVEDHPDMNRFLCDALAAEHRVASARDGEEGLRKAIELRPDLVLSDVMMPGMSGEQLVGAIRGHHELDAVPIVLLTAKADDELRVRLLGTGASDYVTKPFSAEELRARIRNLLVAKHALDAEARLASLMAQAPEGIFVADLEGRYTDVNAAGCRMLGHTREEILGKTIVDLIPEEDVARLWQSRDVLLGGTDVVSEWRLRRKDGTYVPVEVNARILPDGRWQGFVRDVSERHRLAEELRSAASDLNRAQAVARVGSWRLDVHRNELVWTDENHRIFGVPPGTPMTYDTFLAVVHPDDRAYVDEKWRAALAGAPYDIEHRLLVAGEIKWVRERAELTFDAEGRIVGGIGTTQDITDRKRIELALQAAEQRANEAAASLRALADASMAITEAVARLPEGNVTTVMTAIAMQAQLLVGADYVAIGVGTNPDVPFDPWVQIGMPVEIVARLGRAPRPVGTLGLVARQDRDLRVPDIQKVEEFRGFPPGHPVMTSFLGVPVHFRGASVGNLYLANKRGAAEFTAEDQRIVELLAARAGVALETARLYQNEAEGRAWMQTVVDQMPEGAMLLDACGHITTANRSLRALASAETGERDPFGNPVLVDLRLPSGERVPATELPYVRAIEHGESLAGREYQVQRADGSSLPVLASASPVTGAHGARAGAVMIMQDISAMKELDRLREEWTAVVAHDLRQPVNVITLAATVLDASDRTPLPPEKRRKAIGSIQNAAKSLQRMIGDLLDASRIEARRMTLDRRDTALPALVREIVDHLPDVSARCDLTLPPGSERCVLADASRIEQVLSNLITNAAKYGYPDTCIRIEVLPREREIEVVVTNHGPGIAPEELPRLFRRFERTSHVRKGRIPGIGLGLYLSKGLVEAHGGRIWAESTPGATTSFHFTLPYAPLRAVDAAHP